MPDNQDTIDQYAALSASVTAPVPQVYSAARDSAASYDPPPVYNAARDSAAADVAYRPAQDSEAANVSYSAARDSSAAYEPLPVYRPAQDSASAYDPLPVYSAAKDSAAAFEPLTTYSQARDSAMAFDPQEAAIANPYAGMSEAQIAWLGGTDPNDPSIMARLRTTFPDAMSPYDYQRMQSEYMSNGQSQAEYDIQQQILAASAAPNGGLNRGSFGGGAASGQMHDYQHASQLFVGDGGHGRGSYKYAPKHAFMYHLFFDFSGGSGDQTIGMLVKQCSLPKLTFDTKTLNSYNRAYIVQTKVHYDPVSITFHDDNADAVRDFLYNYYKYYYADPSGADWGYRGRFKPFLSSIRIYSLSMGKFSEYILLNPVIKSYSNGEHNAADAGGIVQHQMTVDYENLIFNKGRTSQSSVKGFANLNYDRGVSPFGPPPTYPGSATRTFGSNPNDYTIYSPGLYNGCYNNAYSNPLSEAAAKAFNVVDAVQSGLDALDQFSNGNIIGGLFSAANGLDAVNRLSNGFNAPLSLNEATSLGRNLTAGNNPFSPVQIPSVGGFMSTLNGAAYGVASMIDTVDSIGTRVSSMMGIDQSAPSGGIGQLSSEVSAYMHSDAGYGGSSLSDTALLRSDSYYGATNIQESMPADLTSSNRAALNSNAGYGDTDVRQVNDGFSSYNDTNEYI